MTINHSFTILVHIVFNHFYIFCDFSFVFNIIFRIVVDCFLFNLLCGFFAILTIFKGMKFQDGSPEAFDYYQQATYLIFAACIFDLLDGRVARMCKADGPFGREFDSIADVISFGVAPAMLLARAVLFDLPDAFGMGIAVLYLLCASLRLARFNCMAAAPKKPNQSMDFVGLPVPMAAGAVVTVIWRRAKKKVQEKLGIDENRNKEVEGEVTGSFGEDK